MNELKKALKKKGFWVGVFVLVGIALLMVYHQKEKKEEEEPFSVFMEKVEHKEFGGVNEVFVSEKTNQLTYELDEVTYIVELPKLFISENVEFVQRLSESGVDVTLKSSDTSKSTQIVELFRLGIFLLLLLFFIRMFSDGFGGFKVEEVQKEGTTFRDIAGYDYVKDMFKELVDFLSNPDDYKHYESRLPKGILLEGPPGMGKTLFVKALAGETDTPMFQLSGSDIEDRYVGSGARRVEKIFKTVRKKAEEQGKAILFIDEIDAVGMKRENRTVQETNQTINKLLTEMDGFKKESRIIVIAATNLSSVLDQALTRSGRFDRIIHINRPNLQEREAIISLYLNKKKKVVSEEVLKTNYARVLAQQTQGFSNADLDKLVNEASLIAKRKQEKTITIITLREAFSEIVAGVKTNRRISEEEKRLVAYHEAGHAAARILLHKEGYKGVAYITITPHGESLGHVSPSGEEKAMLTKTDIKHDIMMMLAGRAVEDLMGGGNYTTGAMSDLQQANQQLLAYVARYGMSEGAENLYVEKLDENAEWLQNLLKHLRDQFYQETKMLMETHFSVVETIAEHLLLHTSIEQHELPGLLEKARNK
ncbi:AAA family ATPase (plasmid) [Pontibacillus sp. ALD_SL1]|uniref:AAA family ATPase n=1 Tax=Pontibacillus sp. ALD_SL1 TaxID=2777185 RepID=UPI001A95EA3D|nr:AAA family ATPase [Pontibacillus sp. ALD_SL1]QST02073.1 AAA family ATPase [Pontibacillus sp. ALD_SL1]